MAGTRKDMPIRGLGDLIALMNHNFDVTEMRVQKLKRNNRGVKFVSIVAVVLAAQAIAQCQKQDEELYKLKLRVDELENKEGA